MNIYLQAIFKFDRVVAFHRITSDITIPSYFPTPPTVYLPNNNLYIYICVHVCVRHFKLQKEIYLMSLKSLAMQ